MSEKSELLQKLAEKYRPRITEPYSLELVDEVPLPHPFMIGPRHVEIAARSFGGLLGPEALELAPCEQREGYGGRDRCQLSYSKHKSERTVFIRVPERLGPQVPADLRAQLKALVDDAKADGVQQFAFLEPGRVYRPWVQAEEGQEGRAS